MAGLAVVAPDDGFRERLEWSWRFGDLVAGVLGEVPEIVALAGAGSVRALLEQATHDQDVRLATDYTRTIRLPSLAVAVRIRRFPLLRQYGREVVLRDYHPRGGPTEADKLLTNPDAADVMLYSFLDPAEVKFLQWVLLDLNRLRSVWADADRRARLGARQVSLSAGSAGLALGIEELRGEQVIIRALLAEPAFYSLSQAQDFLAGNRVYQALDPADRRALAMQFLSGTFQGQYYIGSQPLGRPAR